MEMGGPDLERQHLLIGPGDRPHHSGAPKVTVKTLDEILGNRTADGVKIDVEGAELLVLRGGEHALKEHRIRLLQLEWNQCSLDLLGQDRSPVSRLLAELRYSLFRPDAEGNLLPVEDPPIGRDVFAKPDD
jgi:hypothetical protein